MEQFKKLIFEFIELHNGKGVKTDSDSWPTCPIRLVAAHRQKRYPTESCRQILAEILMPNAAVRILLLSTDIETPKARRP